MKEKEPTGYYDWILWKSRNIMKNYYIKENYVHRDYEPVPTDPSLSKNNSEKFQREVYLHAKDIMNKNNYKSIIDVGTGSGYKLMKYFNEYETIGTDVTNTVNWLRKQYPNKNWTDKFDPIKGYDVLISADVIEHIVDPDPYLDFIKNCNTKVVIISTVDRNMGLNENGPPTNLHHCREWNMEEFRNYIGSKFKVISHSITNKNQKTQMIVCENF